MRRYRLAMAGLFLALVAAGFGLFPLQKADSTPPWRQSNPKEIVAKPRTPDATAPLTGNLPFNFMIYNVKNWLVSTQSPPKSPLAKSAIINILAESEPDVIGLCEMGSESDVKEIRELLKDKGLDLPYFHHTGGADRVRHLAILSRFPIISTTEPSLRIPGEDYSMQRGILDATLDIHGKKIRFIGLHMKSKRIVTQFDQALVRVQEASHARRHIDRIFEKDPQAAVIAYGDLNDTTRSLSTRAIFGIYRTPGYLAPVNARDSRGESWTHYWKLQDVYSRIDFVAVSKSMSRRVDRSRSRVVDNADWETASDHRPVFIRFK